MSSKKNKNKAKKAAMTALQNAHNEVSPGEEMYMAPVRDPNTKMTRPASLAGKIDDSKFIVLWTHCINSMCTIPQGRRVPLTHAVRDPIVGEMSEVLTYFKLVHVIEPFKCYPRDREKKIGRVRVQLVGEDGTPKNPEVPTRRVLMMKMGELIPKLNVRQKRLEVEKKRFEAAQQHQAALKAAQASKASGGGGKKRGKKKK